MNGRLPRLPLRYLQTSTAKDKLPQLMRASPVTEWFEQKYGKPTPAQEAAWPVIEAGRSALIISPTGTGKTLAAFLAILNHLDYLHESKELRPGIYALYISPLRALGYDLEKNLNGPLTEIYGENAPIRVALRTGDTTTYQRQKQFDQPPHILLTTPESLCLLLSQKRWLPHFSTLRWVILDEAHSLAASKRGAHLSLSLERLEWLVEESHAAEANVTSLKVYHVERGAEAQSHSETKRQLQRIGLSATVAPATEVARYLTGPERPCEILDVSAAKKIDLSIYSPLGPHPYPPAGYTGVRLIKELAALVEAHRATLVFTNTRSGAEAASFWLMKELPHLAGQIECHHASLDRDVRLEVEDRLKRGELRAVVCSTSLELGIDIGAIDLVVMMSTPKGVSRALQRAGRSGHNIHAVSRGILMATNMNDLVECCATVLLARARKLDRVRIPSAPLDVLAQQLLSMGCARAWRKDEAYALVRRSYNYQDLPRTVFEETLEYLAGGGKALHAQYSELFGKIELTRESFITKTGIVQRDFLQNVGVIPSEGMAQVKLKGRTLGMVEETFLRQLQIGDIFIIGGRSVRLERVGMMECWVSRADNETPTVPRWNAAKMPLTNHVAEEIVLFRSQLRERLHEGASPSALERWIARRLDCGSANARIIYKMFAAQKAISDIPTGDFLLIEELRAAPEDWESEQSPRRKGRFLRRMEGLHYFVHTLIGRAANEALSRVLALRMSRGRGGNAIATPDDYGFVLAVHLHQKTSAAEFKELLAPEGFEEDLQSSLARSDLLKYHFRNAAQTGMMVYRNFFGERKSLRKLQWSAEVIFNVLQQYEPNHILMREARRDAVHTYIDQEGAIAHLRRMRERPIRVMSIPQAPPLSFALFATKIKEALKVEDPRETTERLYHLWWTRIQNGQNRL